ncbi:hypothetical protein KI387_031789, partial [Taxus chinensis]
DAEKDGMDKPLMIMPNTSELQQADLPLGVTRAKSKKMRMAMNVKVGRKSNKTNLQKEGQKLSSIGTETKASTELMNVKADRIWPHTQMSSLSSQGASGGVTCIWDPKEITMITSCGSKGVLLLLAYSREDSKQLLFINVNASTSTKEKLLQWQSIEFMIHSFSEVSLVIGGDINTILSIEEKKGGSILLDASSNNIARFLQTLHLVDVKSGRWKRPKEVWEDRVCVFCTSSAVESEKHFMLECSTYSDIRAQFASTVAAASLQDIFSENTVGKTGELIIKLTNRRSECQKDLQPNLLSHRLFLLASCTLKILLLSSLLGHS